LEVGIRAVKNRLDQVKVTKAEHFVPTAAKQISLGSPHARYKSN